MMIDLLKRLFGAKAHVAGKCIGELNNVTFGSADDISRAEWHKYSTCRGPKPRAELEKIFDVISDVNGKYSDDDRDDAVNDGLWDWLCHQYTLYSVTPLVLHYVVNRFTPAELERFGLTEFVDVCQRSGTQSICLTAEEIEENKAGKLPIFRIEHALIGTDKTG